MEDKHLVIKEAIEKAYGESYEICNPDENGWCKYKVISHGVSNKKHPKDDFHLEDEFYEIKNNYGYGEFDWRPKSLKGIEDNNGWIKIKSEDDLKLPDGDYGFILPNQKEVLIGKVRKGETTLNGVITYQGITHYYPIIKPKPPIY